MLTALITLLALAPEPSPTGPAATQGPAEAPTPALTATPAPPSAAPPPPRFRGVGLMTTAGIFGALGLGANIGRIVTVRTGCKDTAGDPGGCLTNAVSLVALSPVALISNITAFALAGGAGRVHGRYLAHRTTFAGERTRRAGAQIGVGAGLLTLGILGYLGTRVGSFVDVFGAASCANKHPVDDGGAVPPEFAGCLRGKWSGYLAGILVTQSASIVGLGLLTHGATYKRGLRRLRERTDARLVPSLAPTYAGLSLAGRF